MNVLKKILNYLLFSNIFIAICAVAMTFETYLLLLQPIRWDALTAIIFFGTLFIYIFQRIISLRVVKDIVVNRRHSWFFRHFKRLLGLLLISLVVVVYSTFSISYNVFLALLLIAIISIFYGIPLKIGGLFRLRDVGMLKIFLIAFTWAYVTVLVPALNIGLDIWNISVIMLFFARFLFIFAITLPFDLRDTAIDKVYELRTIPHRLGGTATMDLIYLLLAGFIIISGLYFAFTPMADWGHWLLLSVSAGISAYVSSLAKQSRSEYFYLGAIDGLMLLQFILIWLYHISFRIL